MSEFVFSSASAVPSMAADQNNGNDSLVIRLVEDPEIKKTIQFDELSVPEGPKTNDISGEYKKENEVGMTYPVIRINDIVIARENIKSLTISTSGFVPTIELNLMYQDSLFISKNPPKDGDMLSLFIRTSTDALQFLRNDFIITSFSTGRTGAGNSSNTISITGKMFIPGFDSMSGYSARTGTSRDVMRQIAKEYGLGFAFNDYENTKDYMMWIKCREDEQSFITSLSSHAWKDGKSFFRSWIDLYYNLCYVNVNKFLLSDENEEKVDDTFMSNIVELYGSADIDTSVGNARMMPKILTNMQSFFGSPFYIMKWSPTNNSTAVSFNTGYETRTNSYIHNQNIINNDGTEIGFVGLDNVPAYDPTKVDNKILLRGRARYDANENPEGEQARVNYDFVNTYRRDEWVGVTYAMSDEDEGLPSSQWSGNVHKNYKNAPYHTMQNMAELDKIYITVECVGLNLQVMKGERVPVYIAHANAAEEDLYNSYNGGDAPSEGDRFYSGYYIVDSVEYIYKPGMQSYSSYKTVFTLKKREWTPPEAISKDGESDTK